MFILWLISFVSCTFYKSHHLVVVVVLANLVFSSFVKEKNVRHIIKWIFMISTPLTAL